MIILTFYNICEDIYEIVLIIKMILKFRVSKTTLSLLFKIYCKINDFTPKLTFNFSKSQVVMSLTSKNLLQDK